MAEIVTAVYDSRDQLTNVVDDLLSTGIPLELIRVHDERPQVQVATAETTEAEVIEILQRHRPIDLHS
jgi:hypothetical protein